MNNKKLSQMPEVQTADRTQIYEDPLTNIKDEIVRLENSAKEYEEKIANLGVDNSAVQLLDQLQIYKQL